VRDFHAGRIRELKVPEEKFELKLRLQVTAPDGVKRFVIQLHPARP
jgi:hypothetical protein